MNDLKGKNQSKLVKPYIIAEIGSNLDYLNQALESIQMAKTVGADAVKFQCFKAEELNAVGLVQMDIYEWLPKLADKAKECQIDFMCTAFSPKGLEIIDPYVTSHKIASSDNQYTELLEAAAKTDKFVYVSTGGSSVKDMAYPLSILGRKAILMYCNSEYPSVNHDLGVIDELRSVYNVPIGYSDHSIDIYTPFLAWQAHEAVVIEKHFNPLGFCSADSGHSLDYDNFANMVCRLCINSGGSPMAPSTGENAMVQKYNRRLVATKAINIGDALEYGKNVLSLRSIMPCDDPIAPKDSGLIRNKRAKTPFNPGDSITCGGFG